MSLAIPAAKRENILLHRTRRSLFVSKGALIILLEGDCFMMRILLGTTSALALALSVSACSPAEQEEAQNDAHEAGEEMENMAHEAGEAIEDAAHETGEAIEDVGQELQEATDDDSDPVEETTPE
ncbi:MAG: hypothetical protein CMF74_03585 [Maricaulis sp.]|jgi:hypothetical protein|nr:hypothetical protein [Maricaulis sp.]HAQ35091.1 hypothetical protein [Alphaproteobacteria bacterium]|tara:strand:+ start:236 stop:610 length:375 start_codon:yes stop_codon:yes gene_type:complete